MPYHRRNSTVEWRTLHHYHQQSSYRAKRRYCWYVYRHAINKLIHKIYPGHQRKIVRDVTLDMPGSMNLIIKKCFPRAKRVTDRFHVQKLAYEAVKDIRIKHRWETLNMENKANKEAKEQGIDYVPEVLSNGETRRQ